MLGKEQCFIIYLSLLQILGILLFLYGFFPDKINYVYSSMDDLPQNLENISLKKVYVRQKPLMVLMVIDALRYDFVDGNSQMPYLSNEIKNEKNCLLKARVEPPTVTLPRIKALVTGSIPSFYDIVANFGSVELKDDNIISKAMSSGMKVVFYGDDTWLKLFPNKFLRSDGTTSFFVNDFFEVDNNVTRHLDNELNSNDWDIMILHYLGLDHIGHVEGPYGPQIKPKLAEMDNIIYNINTKLISKNQDNPGILIICGDHGMKDSGGHGGTSLSEVLVPVVILNYKCDSKISYNEIKQVDVTPLLSILMGLPIPGGSVGKIDMKLLNGLKPELILYSLYYNTLRMYEIFKIKNSDSQIEDEIQNGNNLYKNWILSNYTNNDYYGAGLKFSEAQKQMSSTIIKDSIRFDDYILIISVVIMFQVVFLIIFYYFCKNINFNPKLPHLIVFILIMCFHYFLCFMSDCDSKMCILKYFHGTLFIFVVLFVNFFFFKSQQLNIQSPSILHVILMSGLILHLVSLTSSSFIEEEHQFWFFMMTTLSIYLLPLDYNKFGLLLTLQIFLRKLNQTGDKWAHLPDIGDWLNTEENKYYLTFYFILGLIFVFKSQLLNHNNMKPIISLIDSCFILCQLITIFMYKTAIGCTFMHSSDSRGIIEARLFWMFTIIRNIVQLYFIKLQQSSVQNSEIINLLINNILSVVTLLSKPHNVILLPSLIFFSTVLSKVNPNCHITQAFFHYWIGVLFYFYQGNSNSIANIDIGVGYTGLEEYNKYITGSYIFIHTYSGQLLSFVLMLKTLNQMILSTYSSLFALLFISSLTTLFYMIVITFQRYHLFVWSVFAPKLMFICAQAGLISFCNIGAVVYFTVSNYVLGAKC